MTATVNARKHYGYLFQVDKRPTKMLDTLLRGIANYIIENIGDVTDKWLNPDKMAAFYRVVGGNYDSFFLNTPPYSISWIYATLGCQHVLLPTADYFAPPSIPSLTKAGFVRWQCIQILLGPEEHVPFMQKALDLFEIRHPRTNEIFPVYLPSEAFPVLPDPEITKWHEECADKLRLHAMVVHENLKTACSSRLKEAKHRYRRQEDEEGNSPRHSASLNHMSEAKRQSWRQNSPCTSSRVDFKSKPEIQDDDHSEVYKVIVEVEPTKSRRPKHKHQRENLRTGQAQEEEIRIRSRVAHLDNCTSQSDEDYSNQFCFSSRTKTPACSPHDEYSHYNDNSGSMSTKIYSKNSGAKEKPPLSLDMPEPICSVRYLS